MLVVLLECLNIKSIYKYFLFRFLREMIDGKFNNLNPIETETFTFLIFYFGKVKENNQHESCNSIRMEC